MRGTRPSAQSRELAVRLLHADVPVYEIADQTGITPTTLYKWAAKEGIALTPLRGSRDGPCLEDGCESAILAKGLCGAHYQQKALRDSISMSREQVEKLLWEKTALTEDGHALWTGSSQVSHGLAYGSLTAWGETRVHRISYRLYVGEIPEGLEIDHLCCVTLCWWPSHLEAVTKQENSRRISQRGRAWWQKPGKEIVQQKILATKANRTSSKRMNSLELWEWVTSG